MTAGFAFDLTIAWALLIAAAVFIYVALDGFDLGVGMLYPAYPARRDRDLLMNALAPVWDGNETWLILGGGGLFAAFPLAYAVLMPAVYLPVLLMLLALIFRGVAFEFRWRARSDRSRAVWDLSFFSGSAFAALAQGIILGALLQGVAVEGRAYAGGTWDWLTPFSLLTGVAVMCGYVLLGACWLVIKTAGDVQDKARWIARNATFGTLAFMGLVSLATPFLEAAYWQRWFTWPGLGFAAVVPAAVAGLTFLLVRALRREGRDWAAMVWALLLFLVAFIGLGISMWPYIIPTSITIWDAATPLYSQIFMFVGAVVLIPVILLYTGYAYWVFRGKLDPDEGYH